MSLMVVSRVLRTTWDGRQFEPVCCPDVTNPGFNFSGTKRLKIINRDFTVV